MNKRNIFAFLVFFLFSVSLSAENNKEAEKILTGLIKKLEKNKIRTDFKLTISDENQTIEEQNGEFLMQNKKFRMITESIEVFFDGKTQWTYMVDDNEVNITEPSEDQMGEINPLFLLNKQKEKGIFKFSKLNNMSNTHSIEMRSKDATVEFKEIIIIVDKKTNQVISIRQNNKDGISLYVEFLKFEDKVKLNDTDFVFDKSKYKDLYENDLR